MHTGYIGDIDNQLQHILGGSYDLKPFLLMPGPSNELCTLYIPPPQTLVHSPRITNTLRLTSGTDNKSSRTKMAKTTTYSSRCCLHIPRAPQYDI